MKVLGCDTGEGVCSCGVVTAAISGVLAGAISDVIAGALTGVVAEGVFFCALASFLRTDIPGSFSTTGVCAGTASVLVIFCSLCELSEGTLAEETATVFLCESDLAFICRAFAVANATNKIMKINKGRKERRTIAMSCQLCTYIGYDM